MMTVAPYGVRTAAVDASVRGLGAGAAVTVVPSATAIAVVATALAMRATKTFVTNEVTGNQPGKLRSAHAAATHLA